MAKVMTLIVISRGGTLAAQTLLALRITQEKTDDTPPQQEWCSCVAVFDCELMEVTGGGGGEECSDYSEVTGLILWYDSSH